MLRLMLRVSAAALIACAGSLAAEALDLDGVDGLNTETIANRERLRVWDPGKKQSVDTVAERDRRDVKPDGVLMGNYLVFPSVGAAVVYDDNIYSRDIEKLSDVRSELTGGVQFQSQLPRHVLDFSLDGKIVNYAEHTDQDYANIRGKAEGALHFDAANTISASLLSALEHEERDDPSYPLTAIGPIEVFHNRAAVGITHDVGRLYGTVSATVESWNFADTTAVNGTPLDQDARDTETYSTQLKLGYRFSPGYEFVGKIRGLRDENRGNDTMDRDAYGFEALAGLAFETNPLLRWRVLGGYGVRDYDQASLENLHTTLLEADVQWLPTQRLTIYGTLSRQILEVTDMTSSGVVQTGLRLRAEYEAYHDLILTVGLQVREDDFNGIDRNDMIYGANIGLDYYFTKNWLFTFGYEHQIRDSSENDLDSHRNLFRVGAKLRF